MTEAPTSPKPETPLRCGVVGVGRMGQHHARVYAQEVGCRLVGVVDSRLARAEEIAERHGTESFPTEEALLEAGVDAVTIAVPTTAHFRSAKPFLESGVACLIEKPLAGDTERRPGRSSSWPRTTARSSWSDTSSVSTRSCGRCARRPRTGWRCSPRFIEVHRVSPMTFRSVDISVVMDMMIHDLDVVLMLMGGREPDEIQASGVAVVTEYEDICNARLTWRLPEGACVANITASRLALKTERVTRITGENAYIKIDYANKSGTVIRRTANEIQMQEVREQLRGGAKTSPASTGTSWSISSRSRSTTPSRS
jgi:predicted dehydrogenase